MVDYIDERYGDPASALGFHNANNWYARGGLIDKLAAQIPPYIGSFDKGGPVPGPIGKPYSATVHGGEYVSKGGEPRFSVVIRGDIIPHPGVSREEVVSIVEGALDDEGSYDVSRDRMAANR
jgi:hypothetical protein